MTNFRNRPKDGYIFSADWQELYILTKHWQSDLLFYKDDIRFLKHLMESYFIWITNKETIDSVRDIKLKSLEIEVQCDSLLDKIALHLKHLANLMEDAFKYDAQVFREEHLRLEDDIADFVVDFRKNRREVFEVTEFVMETEEFVRNVIGKEK